jgi:hypothetical protein
MKLVGRIPGEVYFVSATRRSSYSAQVSVQAGFGLRIACCRDNFGGAIGIEEI